MDIIDEFADRFGEPPREVTALTKLSLLRALSERFHIHRTEWKGGQLIFYPEAPNLSCWSVVFARFPGLSMRGAQTPTVTYRLSKGEIAQDVALSILGCYEEAKNNELQGENS